MDKKLLEKLNEALEQAYRLLGEDCTDFNQLDPVQRMMLVALLHECQKISDYAESASELIAQRFAEDFIPRSSIAAMPSIALVAPQVAPRPGNETVMITPDTVFKTKQNSKQAAGVPSLNFIPVFAGMMLAYTDVYTVGKHCLRHQGEVINIQMPHANRLYVGIATTAEIETLYGLSLLIKGTSGVAPEQVMVGREKKQLAFATMDRMEDVAMLEPFDAQQATGRFFNYIETWKEQLLDMNNAALIVITDQLTNRDLFKPRPYPTSFEKWLESSQLACFGSNTLWLRLDFPQGFDVPDACSVELNVIPVTNVDLNTVTLTPSSPIAKLEKQDDAFYLNVVEQSIASRRQGFPENAREFIIRDFDASRYNNGDLFRDVRMLYNRFVDDYYAFIEYNGIKDGETIRTLRSTITALGNAVKGDNRNYRFDSGTYAMKNIAVEDANGPVSSSVRVAYITTQGAAGNLLKADMILECKRNVGLKPEAKVVVGGMGGRDKASPDERYELLRYHTLTADRLFTRMDVNAFLRKEIMAYFGREEFDRIFIKTSVEGAQGSRALQPGLYVDIEFKDYKNYKQANDISLDSILQQRINRKSCLPMPVIVNLINLETYNEGNR